MTNALFKLPDAYNEQTRSYAPGSPERTELKAELERQYATEQEIPLIIGGREVRTGRMRNLVCPHDHRHILGRYHEAGEAEVHMAVEAALKAKRDWESTPWEDRAAVYHKIASLVSDRYRSELVAATMLHQSKNAHQAEIDAACETADFFRYNAAFMERIYAQQPISTIHTWNRVHYRAWKASCSPSPPSTSPPSARTCPRLRR